MLDLNKKRQLGQFFTTNSDYILKGLDNFVVGKKVTDPFAGDGDLLNWALKNRAGSACGLDVNADFLKKSVTPITHNDSILNSKRYKFVITNPPYLNINKASRETKEKYFSKLGFEDLYQISLASIMNSEEGIVIVPINFLSAENSQKIRKLFFSRFDIVKMNYFKQQVFADTTYNVIAFYYRMKGRNSGKFSIKTTIFPEEKSVLIELEEKFGWSIGGIFLTNLKNQENALGIYRLTENHIQKGPVRIPAAYNHIDNKVTINVSSFLDKLIKSNIILLRAIDSGTEQGKIKLENIKDYGVECLISKPSSRNMIYLISGTPLSINDQLLLIEKFNDEINKLREEYLSLFLTNFRDNDRKRASFDFVYKFLNYLYYAGINKELKKQPSLNYNLNSLVETY